MGAGKEAVMTEEPSAKRKMPGIGGGPIGI
jgi:hypothetical protein